MNAKPDCSNCAVSLLCLAGRMPKGWIISWACTECGKTHWHKIYRYGGKKRTKMYQRRCPTPPMKPQKLSICRQCYMARELAEDKAHEERLRKGEVVPRHTGAWGTGDDRGWPK